MEELRAMAQHQLTVHPLGFPRDSSQEIVNTLLQHWRNGEYARDDMHLAWAMWQSRALRARTANAYPVPNAEEIPTWQEQDKRGGIEVPAAPVLSDDTKRLNWLIETQQVFCLPQGEDTCIMASPVGKNLAPQGFWIAGLETRDVRIAIDVALLAKVQP